MTSPTQSSANHANSTPATARDDLFSITVHVIKGDKLTEEAMISAIQAHFPLKKVRWKSVTLKDDFRSPGIPAVIRPFRSQEALHDVHSHECNMLPIIHICAFECEELHEYRQKRKVEITQWFDIIQQITEAQTSGWLLVHVTSSPHKPKGMRLHMHSSNTVFAKVKADFGTKATSTDACVQLPTLDATALPSAIADNVQEELWRGFLARLQAGLLDRLDARLECISVEEHDLNLKETLISGDSISFLKSFLHLDALALQYQCVSLFENATALYTRLMLSVHTFYEMHQASMAILPSSSDEGPTDSVSILPHGIGEDLLLAAPAAMALSPHSLLALRKTFTQFIESFGGATLLTGVSTVVKSTQSDAPADTCSGKLPTTSRTVHAPPLRVDATQPARAVPSLLDVLSYVAARLIRLHSLQYSLYDAVDVAVEFILFSRSLLSSSQRVPAEAEARWGFSTAFDCCRFIHRQYLRSQRNLDAIEKEQFKRAFGNLVDICFKCSIRCAVVAAALPNMPPFAHTMEAIPMELLPGWLPTAAELAEEAEQIGNGDNKKELGRESLRRTLSDQSVCATAFAISHKKTDLPKLLLSEPLQSSSRNATTPSQQLLLNAAPNADAVSTPSSTIDMSDSEEDEDVADALRTIQLASQSLRTREPAVALLDKNSILPDGINPAESTSKDTPLSFTCADDHSLSHAIENTGNDDDDDNDLLQLLEDELASGLLIRDSGESTVINDLLQEQTRDADQASLSKQTAESPLPDASLADKLASTAVPHPNDGNVVGEKSPLASPLFSPKPHHRQFAHLSPPKTSSGSLDADGAGIGDLKLWQFSSPTISFSCRERFEARLLKTSSADLLKVCSTLSESMVEFLCYTGYTVVDCLSQSNRHRKRVTVLRILAALMLVANKYRMASMLYQQLQSLIATSAWPSFSRAATMGSCICHAHLRHWAEAAASVLHLMALAPTSDSCKLQWEFMLKASHVVTNPITVIDEQELFSVWDCSVTLVSSSNKKLDGELLGSPHVNTHVEPPQQYVRTGDGSQQTTLGRTFPECIHTHTLGQHVQVTVRISSAAPMQLHFAGADLIFTRHGSHNQGVEGRDPVERPHEGEFSLRSSTVTIAPSPHGIDLLFCGYLPLIGAFSPAVLVLMEGNLRIEKHLATSAILSVVVPEESFFSVKLHSDSPNQQEKQQPPSSFEREGATTSWPALYAGLKEQRMMVQVSFPSDFHMDAVVLELAGPPKSRRPCRTGAPAEVKPEFNVAELRCRWDLSFVTNADKLLAEALSDDGRRLSLTRSDSPLPTSTPEAAISDAPSPSLCWASQLLKDLALVCDTRNLALPRLLVSCFSQANPPIVEEGLSACTAALVPDIDSAIAPEAKTRRVTAMESAATHASTTVLVACTTTPRSSHFALPTTHEIPIRIESPLEQHWSVVVRSGQTLLQCELTARHPTAHQLVLEEVSLAPGSVTSMLPTIASFNPLFCESVVKNVPLEQGTVVVLLWEIALSTESSIFSGITLSPTEKETGAEAEAGSSVVAVEAIAGYKLSILCADSDSFEHARFCDFAQQLCVQAPLLAAHLHLGCTGVTADGVPRPGQVLTLAVDLRLEALFPELDPFDRDVTVEVSVTSTDESALIFSDASSHILMLPACAARQTLRLVAVCVSGTLAPSELLRLVDVRVSRLVGSSMAKDGSREPMATIQHYDGK